MSIRKRSPNGPERKLLIITHAFPPIGGIPVQRVLSFASYLPDFGFEVHVLTARNPGAPVRDPGLLSRIPPTVQVHRTYTAELPFSLRHVLWNFVSPRKQSNNTTQPVRPRNPLTRLKSS